MTIAIVGLLPKQQRIVESWGIRARFLHPDDDGPASLGAAVEHVERRYVMTKFMSHKHGDHLPRERVVFVNGGLSSLRRALNGKENRDA
jgi:hypothetical protein